MTKEIKIIIGNSPYYKKSGFGYCPLEVSSLKNTKLKEMYKNISEIAFIPKFEWGSSEDWYKYLDIITFRRLYFLLARDNIKLLEKSPEDIAEEFMKNDIYLINKDNLENLLSNINEKYKEDCCFYFLLIGDEAKKLKELLSSITCKDNILEIVHPSDRSKDTSKNWINQEKYEGKETEKKVEQIKNAKKIFSLNQNKVGKN